MWGVGLLVCSDAFRHSTNFRPVPLSLGRNFTMQRLFAGHDSRRHSTKFRAGPSRSGEVPMSLLRLLFHASDLRRIFIPLLTQTHVGYLFAFMHPDVRRIFGAITFLRPLVLYVCVRACVCVACLLSCILTFDEISPVPPRSGAIFTGVACCLRSCSPTSDETLPAP